MIAVQWAAAVQPQREQGGDEGEEEEEDPDRDRVLPFRVEY